MTYGIPPEKQVPLVGRFYTWALSVLDANDPDAFREQLVSAGRIPLMARTVTPMAVVPRAVPWETPPATPVAAPDTAAMSFHPQHSRPNPPRLPTRKADNR